jgi:AcrR family transcriptional regulator
MNTRRSYSMGARAESVTATRAAIVRATIQTCFSARSLDVTLVDVAARAGVSVQTVLRHFGSRDGLFDVAAAQAQAEVLDERRPVTDDVEGALTALVAHYELRGDFVLGILAEETRDPRAAALTNSGKRLHREWVRETFAHDLAEIRPEEADLLTDLLVVATDVYAWKLLRRDRSLSAAEVVRRFARMAEALTSRKDT